MNRLALDPAWRERLRARIDAPPLAPRVPLTWRGEAIGSVEPAFVERLAPPADLMRAAGAGWEVAGALTETLARIAARMRDTGLAHAWRDEQLPVKSAGGMLLGTVERAAVRLLGIATYAVHLAAHAPDGRHWVQQRAWTKANDPGLWDTLMGGMVPASDTLEEALARETWEEAGLRLAQLRDLAWGGQIATRRPTDEMAGGYVVEWIDWFRCVIPDGVVPVNQDGEVQRFALLDAAQVSDMLRRDEFTREAAAVLSAVSA